MSITRAMAQEVLDACFADLGCDAMIADASGGPAYPARVMFRMADVEALSAVFDARVLQTGRVIDLRVSEVVERPKRGATIEILPGGMALAGVYPVIEEAQSVDRYGLVWITLVSEPA
jgi:hypothetical protein